MNGLDDEVQLIQSDLKTNSLYLVHMQVFCSITTLHSQSNEHSTVSCSSVLSININATNTPSKNTFLPELIKALQ